LDRLVPESPVLSGEIAYAVEHADAVHLSDAVLRRTLLGSAGHPGTAALQRAAAIMADELGWDTTRRQRESAILEDGYPGLRRPAAEPPLLPNTARRPRL
jgi:glycerol-3-phosphate dehydrogenase